MHKQLRREYVRYVYRNNLDILNITCAHSYGGRTQWETGGECSQEDACSERKMPAAMRGGDSKGLGRCVCAVCVSLCMCVCVHACVVGSGKEGSEAEIALHIYDARPSS